MRTPVVAGAVLVALVATAFVIWSVVADPPWEDNPRPALQADEALLIVRAHLDPLSSGVRFAVCSEASYGEDIGKWVVMCRIFCEEPDGAQKHLFSLDDETGQVRELGGLRLEDCRRGTTPVAD